MAVALSAREFSEPSLSAPLRIRHVAMVQRWEQLSFLHWRVDPEALRRVLPHGLEVDTFDRTGWVGLIPFRLTVGLPGVPAVPWVSTFLEANVRTYVRGPDGGRGIWFLSLDAARLGAVAVARRSFRLPYLWARMRFDRRDGIVRYEARRRWPGSGSAGFRIAVAPGERVDPHEMTDLERFLICRWRLYSPAPMQLPPNGIRLLTMQVDHPPWPVRRARLLEVRENLLAAAGVEVLEEEPLAHFSRGVRVRFGRREACS